jgi:hypothetical protein
MLNILLQGKEAADADALAMHSSSLVAPPAHALCSLAPLLESEVQLRDIGPASASALSATHPSGAASTLHVHKGRVRHALSHSAATYGI